MAIAALVLLFWVLVEQRREAQRLERDPAHIVPAPADTVIDPADPGSMARFESGVRSRLGADPPPTRRLVGPMRLELYQIAMDDPAGRPFLRADAVTAHFDMLAVFERRIEAGPVLVERPIVRLVQPAPGGDWNYERVAERMAVPPPAPGEPPYTIVLRDVRIRRGEVDVRTPADRFRFLDVEASLPRATLAHPRDPAPEVVLARVTSAIVRPDPPGRFALTAESGRFTFRPARLDFVLDRTALNGTRVVEARGSWHYDVPGLGLEARARVERLSFADIRFLWPDLPARGEARFVADVDPRPGARTALRLTELVASAPPSELRGELAVVLGGPADPAIERIDLRLDPLELALIEPFTGPLPYTGSVAGRIVGEAEAIDFDMVATLSAPDVPPFAVDLTGRVAVVAGDLALRLLAIDFIDLPLVALRPLADVPVRGLATGRVELTGPPAVAPLDLEARVVLAEGVFSVAGVLDLTGPVPAYDLTGTVMAVNLDLLLEPDVPPVSFSGDFAVVGSGTDVAAAVARIALSGEFTGWQARPGDHLLAAARLERGRLSMETFEAQLAEARLEAAGDWRLVPPLAGQLAYRLQVASLAPFGPYLPAIPAARAGGSFGTAGTLTGTLDRPVFQGTASATQFAFDGWSAGGLEGTYLIELLEVDHVIVVDLVGTAVETPIDRYDTLHAKLDVRPPLIALSAVGERDAREVLRVSADGRLVDGAGQALVRELLVELDREPWALTEPAFVSWEPGAFLVERFHLVQVEDEGRFFVHGRLLPIELADVVVDAAALPIGWLEAALPPGVELEGRVWATGELRGPAAAPRLDLEFRLLEATFNGVALREVRGDIVYQGRRLMLDATAFPEPAGQLEVRGFLPLTATLGIPPSVDWLEAEPITLVLLGEDVPLNVLEGWTLELAELAGTMDVQATVSGTPAAPVLDGHALVDAGEATVTGLNQRFTDMAAEIRLQGRFAEIVTLRARSDGWIQVGGNLLFEPLTRPEANLVVHMDRFRALGVEDRRDPAFWGEVTLTGPIDALLVRGQITVDDGNLPLAELARPDELSPQLLAEQEAAAPLVARPEAVPEPAPILGGVTIDGLQVTAGDGLWFVTDEMRIQMAGDLTVFYSEPDLRVFGVLQGTRGVFTLRVGPVARRFDVEQAEVRFFGIAPPDPAIDFLATRIVPGLADRQVEVQIRLTGTLSTPALALTTPDAAPIPESELLAFIIFGQPGFVMGDGIWPGQELLETAIVGGLAELATIELEDALITDLGLPLDVFRIRPGAPGPFPGVGVPTLVMGLEVADDVFLTVDAGLAIIFGQEGAMANPWAARLEWRIDREWRTRFGHEPVDWMRMFRGVGAALPAVRPETQFTLELRRRWEY